MDEAEARFVGEDKGDLTFVIAEFPSATQALAALKDLWRWTAKRSGVSMWRLSAADGAGRIVAAGMFTDTGYKTPIIGRMKRKGGKLTDLPEDMKIQLANRLLEHAAAGSSGQSWGADDRLEPPEPGRSIKLP